MTSTEKYIEILTNLKSGDLGLLRTQVHGGLDRSVDSFDLFAGLWWPLRQHNQRAPRRQIAWLIAKLYGYCPIRHVKGAYFAQQMGIAKPSNNRDLLNYRRRFNQILNSPVSQQEFQMQWALSWLQERTGQIDWVKLTDDLSVWERDTTRLRWATEYLQLEKRYERTL